MFTSQDKMDNDFHKMELLQLENSMMSDNDSATGSDKAFTFGRASYRDSVVSSADQRQDDDKTTEEEHGRDIRELAQEFTARTTAHGWGRVRNAPANVVKLIWMTFTLVALTCSLVQIGMLTYSFLQYNTEIKWQLAMTEMEFPSVTLCNIQPYSLSTAEALMRNDSSKFYQWYNVTRNLNYFRNLAALLNKSKEFEWVENRMKQPIGYFENIGSEARQVGHQSLDFIIRCTFGFQPCNATNFTFYQNAIYYNCYTFNGGNVSRDKLISKTSGPQEGLSLILYLENDNGNFQSGDASNWGTYHTLSSVGNAGGVRLIVHSPDTRPSPIDQGIDIPPGFSANVGLDVFRYLRQDEPWNSCIEPEEKSTDHYVYSSHACLALCQQEHIMSECACISSTLPLLDADDALQNMTYCAYWNITSLETFAEYFQTLNCEADRMINFATNESLKSDCGCDPPCREFAYKTDLSYSYWPLDFTQEDFYQTLIEESPHRDTLKAYNNLKGYNTTELITWGLIRSNFARVNVYLKAMTIEEYIEQKSYELANLFSDIGGSFGLWIGMSIITWCEVVELTVHMVYHGGKRLRWMWDQAQQVRPADKGRY